MQREALQPGEPWTDRILADLSKMPADAAQAWTNLLQHAAGAPAAAKPGRKWLLTAGDLVAALPPGEFEERAATWLAEVDAKRPPAPLPGAWPIPADHVWFNEPNATTLRGLLWCCVARPTANVCRAVAAVATAAFRKIPRIGPRSIKLGNAAVFALGEMGRPEAVAQLAILKARIKVPTALKGIDKALLASAEKLGMDRWDVEEIAVPDYGLEAVGLRRIDWPPYAVELRVRRSKAQLHWIKPDGREQKTVPAAVRQEHAEDLKELQQTVKEIGKMLPAQAARIEQSYLRQRTWACGVWRKRFLDHPLIGAISRRLIWEFSEGNRVASALFHDGEFADANGRPVTWLTPETRVALWHPLDSDLESVAAWRRRIVALEIQQPFKQAYREVYLLTDAERRTDVYSNRFAAHVLRQHQFHALCVARGWKNTLRLLVDADYPPARIELPAWGLRAEYWIEGAGDDLTESGVYRYLVTDQVRFYVSTAEPSRAHAFGGGYGSEDAARPVPLELIPPVAFSETMRDVDLFVGVASVGNDPHWSDGGPQGRYIDYWQSYSFGELGATAQTRKAVLETLVPRLKIADRCSFSDRFLVVRGDIRGYKIHLGSGNILMEPNDQYLCIVPQQTAAAAGERVFLPFEGDNQLSVILSKAFLLAEDSKIRDKTITSQILR